MLGILQQLGYFLAAVTLLCLVFVGAAVVTVFMAMVKVGLLILASITVVFFCIKAYFESVPSSKNEREGSGSQERS